MVGYLDFSCPYSYAMSERLRPAEERLEWRMVEHAPDAAVPMAGEADPRELEEVRRAAPEVELHPPPGLPNSGAASRLFAGLAPERRLEFMHRVYRALWVEGRDISSPSVLQELAAAPARPVDTPWQAEWEELGAGVPVLVREDGARCLGIVSPGDLDDFLAGRADSLEGVY